MNTAAAAIDLDVNKRQRTASFSVFAANINDLDNDSLVAIADFLPKTPNALLAVALTAPSRSWRELGGRERYLLQPKPRS